MHLVVIHWCTRREKLQQRTGVCWAATGNPTARWLQLRLPPPVKPGTQGCAGTEALWFTCHPGSLSGSARVQPAGMRCTSAGAALGATEPAPWGWSAFLWLLPLPTPTARTHRVMWFSLLTSVLKLRQAGCSCIEQLQWSWGQDLLSLVLNVSENTNCAEAQDKPKRAHMCCAPFWFSICSYLPWFNSESFLEAFISMETFE